MVDSAKTRCFVRQLQVIPRKAGLLTEAHNDDSLPVLWSEALPVNNAVMHFVAELVSQCIKNHLEGVSLVVREKVFHIFKQKRLRSLGSNDTSNIKEQSPLSRTLKAMRSTKRILLANPCNTKWLTWNPPEQYIMIWHIYGGKWHDIANEGMVRAIIFDVGFLREVIPLTGKDTLTSATLETKTNTPNASKQINEPEVTCAFIF